MTAAKSPKESRRGRGEGGLYWDERRQRFIAEVTVGYTPAGKRIVRPAAAARPRPKLGTSSERSSGTVRMSSPPSHITWPWPTRWTTGSPMVSTPALRAPSPSTVITGARTEELRALTGIMSVWTTGRRSPRAAHDRGLALCAQRRGHQDQEVATNPGSPRPVSRGAAGTPGPAAARPEQAGTQWQDHGLVFATSVGTALLAGNVRRSLRLIIKRAGLDPPYWTPRELWHSFVSILSDSGVSIEDIADLCGHSGTLVTEKVYRHQLRSVLLNGAVAMDRIFDTARHRARSHSVSHSGREKSHAHR
jgi:Phage integrase family